MEAGCEDVFDSLEDLHDNYSGASPVYSRGGGGVAFDVSARRDNNAAFTSEDIELALQEAEQLLGAGSASGQVYEEQAQPCSAPMAGHADGAAAAVLQPASAISLGEAAINLRLTLHEKELELLELRAQCAQLAVSARVGGNVADSNAASAGAAVVPCIPLALPRLSECRHRALILRSAPRTQSVACTASCGRKSTAVRLGWHLALQEHGEQVQRQLEAGLEGRDARIAALEAAAARHEAAAARLSQQLAAYRGISPEAAARLQADNTSLQAARRSADAAAAEAERRRHEAAARLAQSLGTWERVQAELQADNARLAAEVQRQRGELSDLYQEKEVFRARAAMLEARAGAMPAPAAAPAPAGQAATRQGEAAELREQLAAVVQRLAGRDAAAKKYKARRRVWHARLLASCSRHGPCHGPVPAPRGASPTPWVTSDWLQRPAPNCPSTRAAACCLQEAVRALKRRTAELEQQLAGVRSTEAAAVSQAQAGAAQQTAALQQREQQLAEARQQCEQYGARLAQVEGQLRKAEFERAQFEWRAQARLGATVARVG